jgi:hypothetical protein
MDHNKSICRREYQAIEPGEFLNLSDTELENKYGETVILLTRDLENQIIGYLFPLRIARYTTISKALIEVELELLLIDALVEENTSLLPKNVLVACVELNNNQTRELVKGLTNNYEPDFLDKLKAYVSILLYSPEMHKNIENLIEKFIELPQCYPGYIRTDNLTPEEIHQEKNNGLFMKYGVQIRNYQPIKFPTEQDKDFIKLLQEIVNNNKSLYNIWSSLVITHRYAWLCHRLGDLDSKNTNSDMSLIDENSWIKCIDMLMLEEIYHLTKSKTIKIISSSLFIFNTSNIYSLKGLLMPNDSLKMVKNYIGFNPFKFLELSTHTVISGYVIPFSCYNTYNLVEMVTPEYVEKMDKLYPKYLTIPIDPEKHTILMSEGIKNKIYESEQSITLEGNNGILSEYRWVVGYALDLLILEEKNYQSIATKHINDIVKINPEYDVNISDGRYVLTDKNHLLRPIRIYKGSLNDIIYQKTPLTRGWLDEAQTFYLSASCISTAIKGEYNHYYSDGKDNPEEVIATVSDLGYQYTGALKSIVKNKLRNHTKNFESTEKERYYFNLLTE